MVKVTKVKVHPNYDDSSLDFDTCILTTEKIELDGIYTNIVCLPEQGAQIPTNDDNSANGIKCYTAGWGATEPDGEGADILKSVQLNVFSDTYCEENSLYTTFAKGSFCAGRSDAKKDSCQGDSGGPLVCIENDVPVLYGIVSYGGRCGDQDYPGIYGDVAAQINWLSTEIGNN